MSHNDPTVMNVFAFGPDLPRTIYAAVMGAHRETYDLILAEADGEWTADGMRVAVTETTQRYAVNLAATCGTHIIYKGAEAYVSKPTRNLVRVPSAGLADVSDLYDIERDGKRGNILIANNLTREQMLQTAVELTVKLSQFMLRFDLPGLHFADPTQITAMAGSIDAIVITGKGVAWP